MACYGQGKPLPFCLAPWSRVVRASSFHLTSHNFPRKFCGMNKCKNLLNSFDFVKKFFMFWEKWKSSSNPIILSISTLHMSSNLMILTLFQAGMGQFDHGTIHLSVDSIEVGLAWPKLVTLFNSPFELSQETHFWNFFFKIFSTDKNIFALSDTKGSPLWNFLFKIISFHFFY